MVGALENNTVFDPHVYLHNAYIIYSSFIAHTAQKITSIGVHDVFQQWFVFMSLSVLYQIAVAMECVMMNIIVFAINPGLDMDAI